MIVMSGTFCPDNGVIQIIVVIVVIVARNFLNEAYQRWGGVTDSI